MNKSLSKNFFLVSFLPAIAYWYLESYYPVKVAVIGGCSLAILEVVVERIWIKHVHALSKLNLFLMLFLGGVSILGEQGIWFKLQPMFSGLCIGIYILVNALLDKSILYDMTVSLGNPPPREIFNTLERHISFFLIAYGIFMGMVAFKLSTDIWLFFKTAGFYILSALFFVFEIIFLRNKLKAFCLNNSDLKAS